ncbi:MAG TPA: hypothetical protein ENK14_13925 [Caldithrix sp.]|nr:hypothetical protein [Caldithrix sp.]
MKSKQFVPAEFFLRKLARFLPDLYLRKQNGAGTYMTTHQHIVAIFGAGVAGSEAAFQLALHGI